MPSKRRRSDEYTIEELMDASPAIISLINTHGWEVRYQNESGRKLLGDLAGKTCHEEIAQQPSRCSFCRATEALETRKMTSSEVPMPDGRWLLVQWAPIRSKNNVMSVVETITDVTEGKRRELEYRCLKEQFEELATHDPLTGLLNRRGWLEKAERVWRRAVQDALPVGLLLLDVDHFKQINDTWGHPAGDNLLQGLGSLLSKHFRPGDVVGRWGGEEFIVMLAPPVAELPGVADRVREIVERSTFQREEGAPPMTVTISVGGVTAPGSHGGGSLNALIHIADQRLYLAKERGRNQVVISPERERPAQEQAQTVG